MSLIGAVFISVGLISLVGTAIIYAGHFPEFFFDRIRKNKPRRSGTVVIDFDRIITMFSLGYFGFIMTLVGIIVYFK